MADPVSQTTDEIDYRAIIDGYKIALCDATDHAKKLKTEIERLRAVIAGIGVQQNVKLIWKLCEEALK